MDSTRVVPLESRVPRRPDRVGAPSDMLDLSPVELVRWRIFTVQRALHPELRDLILSGRLVPLNQWSPIGSLQTHTEGDTPHVPSVSSGEGSRGFESGSSNQDGPTLPSHVVSPTSQVVPRGDGES